jgi:periplasmic copper chaperone A
MNARSLLLALLLLSEQVPAAPPLAEQAWIRLLPGELPLAGYLVLQNPGDRALTLTGAHSPVFGQIELHESRSESGVARMRRLERVAIPPGGRLVFAPGGYHLMMFERMRPLQAGDQVPVTLDFDDGYHLQVTFGVREATAR